MANATEVEGAETEEIKTVHHTADITRDRLLCGTLWL